VSIRGRWFPLGAIFMPAREPEPPRSPSSPRQPSSLPSRPTEPPGRPPPYRQYGTSSGLGQMAAEASERRPLTPTERKTRNAARQIEAEKAMADQERSYWVSKPSFSEGFRNTAGGEFARQMRPGQTAEKLKHLADMEWSARRSETAPQADRILPEPTGNLPVHSQLRTCRRAAITDVMCQKATWTVRTSKRKRPPSEAASLTAEEP